MQSSAQPQAQQQQAQIASTSQHQPAQQLIYQVIGPLQPMYPPDSNFYVRENYAYMPNALHSQATMLPQAFQTMTPQDPSWNMDTGASSHLADNTVILTSFSNSSIYPSVFFDNGHFIPVIHIEYRFLHTSHMPLHLNHILVTPHIIKNLIYVCKFTCDNDVSVKFDAYCFSIKITKLRSFFSVVIVPDIFTHPPSPSSPFALLSFSHSTWHRRLGHPGDNVTSHLISCNKSKSSSLCHACQLAIIFKPLERMTYHVTTTSPLPHSHVHAFRDSNWKEAMLDAYNALVSNGTYKDRLVANGQSQQQGIDCDETFSSIVKPTTIHTVLSLAVSHDWPIHHLDVKNAFLHVHLSETVYMHQPPNFVNSARRDYSKTNASLFGYHFGSDIAYLLSRTPVDTESKIGPDGDSVSDSTLFRSLAGALRRYVHGTLNHGLQLHVSTTTQLTEYTDADWAEAEYHGVANVVAETAWIHNLLLELHAPLHSVTLVYCDNVSVVYLSTNLVQHQRTKHIEIDIHFVRDYVASRQVHVLHVSS
nr:ribonuclease H-like domain-containing protein [Tanacetum cinerariifolium]